MSNHAGLFNPDQHLSHEGVALYVDALKLDRVNALPPEVGSHVEECLRCKGEIFELHRLLKDETYFSDAPHPTLSEKERGPAIPLILKIAAAAVALVGTGVLLSLLFRAPAPAPPQMGESAIGVEPPPAVVPAQPTGKNPGPDPLAFAESAGMEALVGGTFRSAGTGEVFPPNGSRVRPGTNFRWEGVEGGEEEFLLLNNREAVLRRAKGKGGYLLRDSLSPGLYYWKILREGELLHVGKFLVE